MIDHSKKYIRNTHINGEFREDMRETWDKIPKTFSGLIHSLDPVKPMYLYEVITAIYEYASQNPMDNDASFFTVEVTYATLQLLVNFDMVKVISEQQEKTK